MGKGRSVESMSGKTENEADSRLKELILYVSDKALGDKGFGLTKLNKILFNADFYCFARTGKSISGAEYHRNQFGPTPKRMKPILASMTQAGELVIRPGSVSATQKRPLATRAPDLAEFTGEEIAIVDGFVETICDMTASAASDLSHKYVGWRLAQRLETIPYSTVFAMRDIPLTEGERERGRKLAASL